MGDNLDLGKLGYDIYLSDRRYKKQLKETERDAEASAHKIGSVFAKLGAIIAAAFSFKTGLDEARRFSKELANVKSIADDLSKAKLRKEILKLNPVLGTAAELTNALFFAYSSGVKGNEHEMAQFTGKVAELAKTIGAGITPTMDAFTTIMNAYGLEVKDAGNLSDWFFQIVKDGKAEGDELATSLGQIIGTAATAKIPLDELGAAIATLTNTMPTRQAITSLNQAILGFIQPTTEAKRVAAELGIELSAATLKNKGLAGALAEVNAKAGDNVDALTAMFTSVQAFKAAASLAGTQSKDFQEIVTNFANKGGAAAKGFTESIDNLDDQLIILTNTGKRLLEMVVNIIIQAVTLNGALVPVFKSIGNINAATLETIGKLAALVAGTVAVKKALDGLSALKTGFIGLAIKGGYQTAAMKEAELAELSAQAVKASELQKELAIKKTDAVRQAYLKQHELDLAKAAQIEAAAAVESAKTQLAKADAEAAALASSQRNAALHEALSAKKIMLDKQEVASAAAKALAIEQTNLRMLQAQNERNRYQYTMMGGSAARFKPDPALQQSQQQLNVLTKEYAVAQNEAASATRNFEKARSNAVAQSKVESVSTKDLSTAKSNLARTENELTAAKKRTTRASGEFTVASKAARQATMEEKNQLVAATAAQNAHTAATKTGARAVGLLKGGLKSLFATMLANPLTLALTILGGLAAAVMYLSDQAKKKAEAAIESAAANTKEAEKLRDAGKKLREEDSLRIERLKQLAEKEQLNNTEMSEVEGLLGELDKRYKDIGVELDKTTGKLNVQAGAWDKVKGKMLDVAKTESMNVMRARAREIEVLKAQYSKMFNKEAQNWGWRDKHDLGALSDADWERGLRGTQMSAEQKKIVSEYLNAKAAYRAENQRFQALQSGDLDGGEKKPGELKGKIEATKKEKELRREIELAELKEKLLKDGVLSRKDELELIKKQIKLEKERAEELENTAEKSLKSDDLETRIMGMEAQRDAARTRASQYELEREKVAAERAAKEEERDRSYTAKEAEAWSDGRLSYGEKVELAKLKLQQQQERVAEAKKKLEEATADEARKQAEDALNRENISLGQATAELRETQQSSGQHRNSVQTAIQGSVDEYRLRVNTGKNLNQEMLQAQLAQVAQQKKTNQLLGENENTEMEPANFTASSALCEKVSSNGCFKSYVW
jgi:TP901 family phage tail tape measure protein